MATKSSITYFDARGLDGFTNNLKPIGPIVPVRRSVTGNPLPFHEQIIQDKGSATTLLSATEQTYTINSTGFIRGVGYGVNKGSDYSSAYCGYSPTIFPVSSVPASVVDEAKAQAIQNAYSKIRKYQEPFNGQQFLGELHQTVQLLRHPLKGVEGLTQSFLAKKANSTPKAIANLWLQYRFGVLPLISDTESILNLIRDKEQQADHEAFKAYGSASYSPSSPSSFGNGLGSSGTSTIWSKTSDAKVENFIRVGMQHKYLDNLSSLSSRLSGSLGSISSLPLTAWELLPFSWVADYFVNVQGLLTSALTSQAGVSYVSNSVVITATDRYMFTGLTSYDVGSRKYSVSSAKSVTLTERAVSRTGILQEISPVVFHLPGSKIRYANLAALATQLLK